MAEGTDLVALELRFLPLEIRWIFQNMVQSQQRLHTSAYGAHKSHPRQCPIGSVDQSKHLPALIRRPALHCT